MADCPYNTSGLCLNELLLGEEIILATGFGYSPFVSLGILEPSKKQIIVGVRDCSALTAEGIILECTDAEGIELTGTVKEIYEVSELAKIILEILPSKST